MIQNYLEKFGFDKKEAKLYLALLELGEGTIQDMSRKSGLKRTTVYNTIDSLKKRALISSTIRGKKTLYLAEDPRTINNNLEEKKAMLNKIMPELLSITNFLEKKPTIKYFEGIDGIKEIYKDILNYPGQENLAWWSESYEVFGENFFYEYYLPLRIKKKILSRVITQDNKYWRKIQKNDTKELRQIKLAPLNARLFELEISLYGNSKIGIMSFQEKFGLIIESRALYNTLKSIFELQWQSLAQTQT